MFSWEGLLQGSTVLLLVGCQIIPRNETRIPAQALIHSHETIPDLRVGADQTPDYRVQEGDMLSFRYYYTPELDDSQRVRSDGKVSLTYLPDIAVADMTIDEVRNGVTVAYAGILNKPIITVSVVDSSAGRVFIGGEVNRPGEVALGGRSSFVQMLFKAGGLKPSAAGSRAVLIRHDSDGQTQRMQVDVDAILAGRGPSQDIRLLPYDIVYVPQSAIAKVDEAADQYVHRLVPVAFVAQHTSNAAASRESVVNSTTTTALPTAVTPP